MMSRLFGKKAPEKAAPTLDDASTNMEARSVSIDGKVKQLDDELMRYSAQMKKLKKGTPQHRQVQQRALRVLKQKKMYEKQKDTLSNQQFNIDSAKFATENLKDNALMAQAMKATAKDLKAAYKELDIDEVEDMHDDMAELMEQSEEINELMGRSFAVPEDIDEADLEGELAGLEAEMGQELDDEIPDYLVSAASAANKDTQKQSAVEKDQFGLPQVPPLRQYS